MLKQNSAIRCVLILLLSLTSWQIAAESEEDYQQVVIADPFIELHTGPGRGYPVFHVVERGETISIIKKRTQWYKVRSPRGKVGWAHENQLERTLTPEGEAFETDKPTQQAFIERAFEAGIMAGDFDGATVTTLHGGWNWTENITMEIAASQALGNVSDIQFVNLNIMHQPFPEWIVSPYIKLGTGIIRIKPRSTLVFPEDREDEMVHAGVGIKAYVSRQFFIRAEYNAHTILTSRNDNDEVEEWKIGFSVFF